MTYQPDLDAIRERVDQGLLRATRHNYAPYTIYCYTKEAQYKYKWDEHLIHCRGQILVDEGAIIARPISKFCIVEEQPRSSTLYPLPSVFFFFLVLKHPTNPR